MASSSIITTRKCRRRVSYPNSKTWHRYSLTRRSLLRCTLRFPSTDLCISFCSLMNQNIPMDRNSTDSLQQRRSSSSSCPSSTAPIPLHQQQQVILVAVNQQASNHFPPLSIQIPNSSTSSIGSSLSAGSSNEPMKSHEDSPPGMVVASMHHHG